MNLRKTLDVTIVLLMIAILTTISLPICIAVIEQRTEVHAQNVRAPAHSAAETIL